MGLRSAPLWNRTLQSTPYTTYAAFGSSSLSETATQPGAASLACLSCHDGQQAIDAIMNMPGPGRYSANPDSTFLDGWPGGAPVHNTLPECAACHAPGTWGFANTATDFSVFIIGTDLRNDHPIGVRYPADSGSGTDWQTPTGSKGTTRFFDEAPADGRMDKGEIRLYDSGGGPEVECASCHDPHGVPSAGPGSTFFPTFLRKSNVGSGVCLTCHAK